jgi:hypothetical protein
MLELIVGIIIGVVITVTIYWFTDQDQENLRL